MKSTFRHRTKDEFEEDRINIAKEADELIYLEANSFFNDQISSVNGKKRDRREPKSFHKVRTET